MYRKSSPEEFYAYLPVIFNNQKYVLMLNNNIVIILLTIIAITTLQFIVTILFLWLIEIQSG
jgi:hypothetical protein